MITDVAGLYVVRRPLRNDGRASEHASAILHATLDNWQLADLLTAAKLAVDELMRWMDGHGTSDLTYLTVTWDQALLITELHDRGGLVPEPRVSRVDAELAIRLLTPLAVEWGAGLDSRGRRLWVAFAVPDAARKTLPPDDRGRAL